MSFPRAKIKRFNEIPTTTPSPAEYNVDLKQKLKLGIIPQSERFTETKSPAVSETGSTQSTPCFRTPTLLKKKKFLSSAPKPTIQNLFAADNELLNAMNIECKNKDLFIEELFEQIEELKNKIYNLNCEKQKLEEEKIEFEEKISKLHEMHKSEISDVTQEHANKISNLDENILKIEEKIRILEEENENLKSNNKILQHENEVVTEKFSEEIKEKNKMIESCQTNLKEIIEEKDLIQKGHIAKLDELEKKHKEEIENIQLDMLKCVHDVMKSLDEEKTQNQLKIKELKQCFETEISNLKESFNNEKELSESQNTACIKQLKENLEEMKIFSGIQADEKCAEIENYWKRKLEMKEQESSAILKECQAISEYNIIQSELEKNDFRLKFETKTIKYNDLEKKYDSVYFNYKQLQASYSNIQNKLYRLIKELREKDSLKNQLNQLLSEKQTYETTVLRCQQTIDILKRRLRESDQDVEQLKNEISENEKKLLEFENKLSSLQSELCEAHTINDELEMNNESTIKLTKEEVEHVKLELLEKLEELIIKAEKDKLNHMAELEKKEEEKNELLKMIKEQQILNTTSNELITKAEQELERLAAENSDYAYQVEILNRETAVLQIRLDTFNEEKQQWSIDKKELDLKIDILKNEVNQLKKYEEEFKDISERVGQMKKIRDDFEGKDVEKNSRICELEKELEKIKKKYNGLERTNMEHLKTIEEQKLLIEPFKEELEAYELEMKNLKSAKDQIETEAKDLGIKYAQILGHQNHKQKIKYMVTLKSKNEELLKTNLDLESKVRTQDKKIEKLRKENAELKRNSRKPSIFEDKENIASPNKSFKCDSPGPLREIN